MQAELPITPEDGSLAYARPRDSYLHYNPGIHCYTSAGYGLGRHSLDDDLIIPGTKDFADLA